jgi:hypothetical protein
MVNYIIDKNITITGNLTVNGSIINIMTKKDYDNYNKNNLKSITELTGDTNIYNDDLNIENNLICINFGNDIPELIVNGCTTSLDFITLDSGK